MARPPHRNMETKEREPISNGIPCYDFHFRSHGMCEIRPGVYQQHLFISRCTISHEPWHNGISVYLFIIIITYYYYFHLAFQSVPNHPHLPPSTHPLFVPFVLCAAKVRHACGSVKLAREMIGMECNGMGRILLILIFVAGKSG